MMAGEANLVFFSRQKSPKCALGGGVAFNSTFYFCAYFLLSSTLLYTHLIVLFTLVLIYTCIQ